MKALIGKKAPEFHAPAVVNGNEIIEDFSAHPINLGD